MRITARDSLCAAITVKPGDGNIAVQTTGEEEKKEERERRMRRRRAAWWNCAPMKEGWWRAVLCGCRSG